jgi:enamine deaminase RidA (YjgF/YER057c/UK114 family)
MSSPEPAVRRTPSASRAYSAVVSCAGPGRWLHVAGQLGLNASAPGGRGSFAVQAARAFDALAAVLAGEGARLSDVVRMTVYVTSFAEWDEFAAIRAARFAAEPPASTAVRVVELLGGASIEIDAIAFLPAGGGAA